MNFAELEKEYQKLTASMERSWNTCMKDYDFIKILFRGIQGNRELTKEDLILFRKNIEILLNDIQKLFEFRFGKESKQQVQG